MTRAQARSNGVGSKLLRRSSRPASTVTGSGIKTLQGHSILCLPSECHQDISGRRGLTKSTLRVGVPIKYISVFRLICRHHFDFRSVQFLTAEKVESLTHIVLNMVPIWEIATNSRITEGRLLCLCACNLANLFSA